jgi:outer membrane lipoprotein LolB
VKKIFPIVLLLLSACTTLSPQQRQHYHERIARIDAISAFTLAGRIGLKQNGKGFAAGVNWRDSAEHKHFELTGPLGGVHARLREENGGAVLDIPDQAPVMSRNAETLLSEHFGWAIPINNLRYWVRGVATPPLTPLRFDAHGLPAELREDGWQIRYLAWQQINGVWLPEKLEATRDNLVIKLSIHDWQF